MCFFAGSAHAQDVPGQAHIILGIVKCQDGTPLADATIFLSGVPPIQSSPDLTADELSVVTDNKGHFTWRVPSTMLIVPETDPALDCWALAADRSMWSYKVSDASPTTTKDEERDLLTGSVRPCETAWLTKGSAPVLSVTAPDTATVEAVLHGPDGQVLRDHLVEVAAPGRFVDYSGAVVYSATTDSDGKFITRWFPSIMRFQVVAPGIGFTGTGTFEALPDAQVHKEIPNLAPFASISGTISPSVETPEVNFPSCVVSLNDYGFYEYSWMHPTSTVDPNGFWALQDVLPGSHHLELSEPTGVKLEASVPVEPGQSAAGVKLLPLSQPSSVHYFPQPSISNVVLHGQVLDTNGNPVGGAAVYAACSYRALQNDYQKVLLTTADDAGRYIITGMPVGEDGVTMSLVAHHSGYAIGEASARFGVDGLPDILSADLVLSSQTSSITVRILDGGKPRRNATVWIWRETGDVLFDRDYKDDNSEALSSLLSLKGKSGANGKVCFPGIAPGLWDVAASTLSEADETATRNPTLDPAKPILTGRLIGIGVLAGETRSVALNIVPAPAPAAFEVIKPDGKEVTNCTVSFGIKSSRISTSYTTRVTVGADGIGRYDLGTGVYQIQTRSWDLPLDPVSVDLEPYYEAHTMFAVSTALDTASPTKMHTRLTQPGSIEVRLLGRRGTPAPGAVVIGDSPDNVEYAAATDGAGVADFQDMNPAPYCIVPTEASLRPLPSFGDGDDPFPIDAALSKAMAILPQTVSVQSGQKASVAFFPVACGYVTGKLTVGGDLADYELYHMYDPICPALVRLNVKTGQYVAGPFLAGKNELILSLNSPEWAPYGASYSASFTVVAGKALHLDLTKLPMPQKPYDEILPADTVYLADAKTPAWHAHLVVFRMGSGFPFSWAETNALGHPTVSRYLGPTTYSPEWLTSKVTHSFIAAWLPGSAGCAIVPCTERGQKHIFLPATIAVHGTVTVSGQSVTDLTSSFRIYAEYQGADSLKPLLSVEATAQADGSFELPGLTPGTYVIQATRDNIWVSESHTVFVRKRNPPDLHLDIPLPGQAVDLSIVDSSNHPISDAEVAIGPSAGPLTNEIWPKKIQLDQDGCVHLEGLDAGPHSLRVYRTGASKPIAISSGAARVNAAVLNIPIYTQGNSPLDIQIKCASAR
jgi:hypothetical protein